MPKRCIAAKQPPMMGGVVVGGMQVVDHSNVQCMLSVGWHFQFVITAVCM